MSNLPSNAVSPTLIFFIGKDRYFLSHRLPASRAAIESGFSVHVLASDSGLSDEISQEGVSFSGRWLGDDKIALLSIFAGFVQVIIKSVQLRATTVHIVGFRYGLVGLLASVFLPRVRFIFSINGLGFLFVGDDLKVIYRIARRLITLPFTLISFFRRIDIIFQNEDDLSRFTTITRLRKARVHLIRGSGVDTMRYKVKPLPAGSRVIFGVTSRMVRMKGIADIIAAFRRMIDDGMPVGLRLAGDLHTGHPDSLEARDITSRCGEGEIEWLGYVEDVEGFWEDCDVAMLGSHGGEGVPMALLIPAAMGRALVCSDANGNRDLVDEGINGFLFAARDVDSIIEAVGSILDSDLSAMGRASRDLIHRRGMDAESISKQFEDLYSN